MLTKTELKHLAVLLDRASNEFSNHTCNDLPLDNTDENWQFVLDMEKWNKTPKEDMPKRPKDPYDDIYVMDWFVMSYLRDRIESLIKEEEH